MEIKNEDIRNFLVDEYGEEKGNDIVLLPDYAKAFEGIAMFSLNAIYSWRKMVLIYALGNHMAIADAVEEVKQEIDDFYKVLKSKAPIINMGNPFENDKKPPNHYDIRDFLTEEFGDKGEYISVFSEFAPAFTGMSMFIEGMSAFTNRAIYDFRQMIDLYASENHVTDDDALKDVQKEIDALYTIYEDFEQDPPIVSCRLPLKNGE